MPGDAGEHGRQLPERGVVGKTAEPDNAKREQRDGRGVRAGWKR